jgi:hypothetical protein
MVRSIRLLVVVGLSCLLLEGCVAPPKRFLDENVRSIDGGRESLLVVPQGEIRGKITPSTTSATGGLIFVLIDVTVNQIKTNMAERQVTPLRTALADYDFDHRAVQALQSTLVRIPWLDIKSTSFTKDGSIDKLTSFVDQSDTSQSLVASYDYAMSPNFAWMTATLSVGIYPKQLAPAPGASPPRLTRADALYFQRFEYIEYLANDLKDDDKNADSWAVNGGAQARTALDKSLVGVHDLFVRSMSLTAEAASALDRGRNIDMSDEHGSLVESNDKGMLLYNKDTGTWLFFDGKSPPN